MDTVNVINIYKSDYTLNNEVKSMKNIKSIIQYTCTTVLLACGSLIQLGSNYDNDCILFSDNSFMKPSSVHWISNVKEFYGIQAKYSENPIDIVKFGSCTFGTYAVNLTGKIWLSGKLKKYRKYIEDNIDSIDKIYVVEDAIVTVDLYGAMKATCKLSKVMDTLDETVTLKCLGDGSYI